MSARVGGAASEVSRGQPAASAVLASAAMGVVGAAPFAAATTPSGARVESMGASDLAEILSRFSQASEALQRTHETLQAEVARLSRELGEANEELQRSRRLAALGEMAAGIAHEVRNPLASIALDARMLEVEAGERDEAATAARRIGTSVRGLDRVVGDVLCFARELRPRLEVVDAHELFERSAQECGALACAAGVGLEIDGEDGEPAAGAGRIVVRCDGALAHRAITNLVRNAIEAVAERGGVDGVRRVRMWARRRARSGRGEAVVGVSDSGPGIEGSIIDRMFNPFFTTRAAGTGLGLAIVHRIMDAHGGRVEARNNVESGAEAGRDRSARGPRLEWRGGATFELLFPEPSVRGQPRRVPMEKDR